MRHCADREATLNDYLDGLLSEPDRTALEAHLEGCAICRQFLTGLRSLRARTQALPRGLEPERDLWPGIREALSIRRAGLPGSFTGFPAWIKGWSGLVPAAASIAVILVIVAVAMIALRQSAVPPDAGKMGAPGAGSGEIAQGDAMPPAGTSATAQAALAPQQSLAVLEAEYRAATEKLLAALQRERGAASPAAVQVIEENLRVVDRAIQEIHRAAADHPGQRVDERVVASLYRTRFELLRQAVRLVSREGEEKKS
jgi:hypothetical protein